MNLIRDLVEKPPKLTTASRYTVLDGVVYLIAGATLIVWPGVVQTLFREEAFVGHEGALMRAIGMTIVLIGWLYVFGGRSGARQIVAASVIEPVAPELERIAALEDKKGFAKVVAYSARSRCSRPTQLTNVLDRRRFVATAGMLPACNSLPRCTAWVGLQFGLQSWWLF